MRAIAMVLLVIVIVGLLGCNNAAVDWDKLETTATTTGTTSTGTTTSTTTATNTGPEPLSCNGLCVETAPATFTGPSLFWIGDPKVVPACPPETPYQGVEGFVNAPMFSQFARECLVTPSDLCNQEGKTCIPQPSSDYHVCIHHDDESDCRTEYPEQRTMFDVQSAITVTLCCQKLPISP